MKECFNRYESSIGAIRTSTTSISKLRLGGVGKFFLDTDKSLIGGVLKPVFRFFIAMSILRLYSPLQVPPSCLRTIH